jgi:hypothetical protein
MVGPRNMTKAPSAPLGMPAPEPVVVAGVASGTRCCPMAPSSPEWKARVVATPRWHNPMAGARALAVEEVAVAGRGGSWTQRRRSWTWRLCVAP